MLGVRRGGLDADSMLEDMCVGNGSMQGPVRIDKVQLQSRNTQAINAAEYSARYVPLSLK